MMQQKPTSLQIHAWVAWLLFVSIAIILLQLVPVFQYSNGVSQNALSYLIREKDRNVVGLGLSDWQGVLFLVTSLSAMIRIAQRDIQPDGRGLNAFALGALLFLVAWRLETFPRLACLGLPLMLYGGTRHIFGPPGKCIFIPCLILLLMIPLRQITWLENMFFSCVESLLVFTGRAAPHGHPPFLLCNDFYLGAVLRDTLTSLLLLFFFSRMRTTTMGLNALLVLTWSLFAALAVYVLAVLFPVVFHDLNPNTLARTFGWAVPLIILLIHVFYTKRLKSHNVLQSQLDKNASTA